MRAAVLHTPGEPPRCGEHPEPEPAAGHTVVAVTAAPVVPLDLLCASGTSYFGVPAVPYVPGVQGVGVVRASGTYAAGARVWFATSAGMAPGDGSLAELCRVPDQDVVPLTDDVGDAAMAALGLSAVAAYLALTWRASLQAGERVVVLGAGGTVGQAAVGLARVLGAGRVVAVCRPGSVERAWRAGADEVVALTTELDDVDRLAAATRGALGGDADVVIDPVFGRPASAAARVLAPFGRLVNIGGSAGDTAEFSSAALRSRTAAVLGYTNNAITPDQRRAAITAVAEHAAAGAVAATHEVLPLAGVADAWRRVATGDTGARLVLTP